MTFIEEGNAGILPVQAEADGDDTVENRNEGREDPPIALRILMKRHKVSCRAINDIIAFVNLKPDMQRTKNVEDVLQRSTLPGIEKKLICGHCCEVIENGVCGDEEW